MNIWDLLRLRCGSVVSSMTGPFWGEQLELIGVVEHAFIRAQSGDAVGVAPGECVGEAERELGWGRECERGRGRVDHTESAYLH